MNHPVEVKNKEERGEYSPLLKKDGHFALTIRLNTS